MLTQGGSCRLNRWASTEGFWLMVAMIFFWSLVEKAGNQTSIL